MPGEPRALWVELDRDRMMHAFEVAEGRKHMGIVRPPDSGVPSLWIDWIGAVAEIAVCDASGIDYKDNVTVLSRRPGAIPDLTVKGFKVSVKGRERFASPLDLIVMEHDTENDLYVLCSVDPLRMRVAIRGYCTRKELLSYKPEVWKWDKSRPGAAEARRRRYVPVESLHPFKGTGSQANEPLIEAG